MSNINARVQRVLSCKSKPTVIIGIGNAYRSDDGVGPYIVRQLFSSKNVLIINAQYNPENYIDKIVAFLPKSIVIIDAADFGGEPGEIKLIDEREIPQTTLSTHSIPLSVISQVLIADTKATLDFIGIQIKNVIMGEGLSLEIKESADKIVTFLNKKEDKDA